MDKQEIEALAMKVLAHEASPAEIDLLESLIAKDSKSQTEFCEIQESLKILRGAAPLAKALGMKEPELPAYRLNELRAAVRAEFPRSNPVARKSPGDLLRELLSFRIALGGGLAIMALACFLILFPVGREIELGMYEEFVTRGASNSMAIAHQPNVRTVVFQKEAEFEKWRKEPLSRKQKAKVWVDEETDTIHILRRDANGIVRESTEKLNGDARQRQRQFEKSVNSLQ